MARILIVEDEEHLSRFIDKGLRKAGFETVVAADGMTALEHATGGGVDLVARTIAERIGKPLGQSIIVENQAGGGGVVASLATARAAPDGYTLMLGYVATHGTSPATRKVPYDAVRDFTPIARTR